MKKLNAKQVGTLALICEAVCKEFPALEIVPDESKIMEIQDRASPDFQMEAWEVRLKELINAEPSLPTYDERDGTSSLSFWVDMFMNTVWE